MTPAAVEKVANLIRGLTTYPKLRKVLRVLEVITLICVILAGVFGALNFIVIGIKEIADSDIGRALLAFSMVFIVIPLATFIAWYLVIAYFQFCNLLIDCADALIHILALTDSGSALTTALTSRPPSSASTASPAPSPTIIRSRPASPSQTAYGAAPQTPSGLGRTSSSPPLNAPAPHAAAASPTDVADNTRKAQCIYCQAAFAYDADNEGQEVPCPNCGKTLLLTTG